jgi:type IV secretory pathway TrbD component
MVNMSEFKRYVHRSLLQREMLGGIPQQGLLILFILTVVFVYTLRLYFMLIPIIILYVLMRVATKRDQWLIDNFINSIMNEKDKLIP